MFPVANQAQAKNTRIGLNTTASIGAILQKIAGQIGVDLKYDPSLISVLKQRITALEER